MKKLLFVFAFLAFFAQENFGQFYIGVKGGLGLNMQKWNSYERDILFTPCIDIFRESNDDPLNKLYVSLGYHTRGSTIRGFGLTSYNAYKFNNVVLEIGGKRMLSVDKKYNGYYMLALRAEYTIFTNLNDGATNSIYNLVDDEYVKRFIYGATVGGGFEMNFGENRVIFLELSVNPDLSKQYEQLQTLTVKNPNPTPNPFNNNQYVTIGSQEVRNVSLEIKVGIKFLRGYYDE